MDGGASSSVGAPLYQAAGGGVLQVLGGYLQYPTPPKPPDQARRETPGCVNPAGYLQYFRNLACFVGLVRGVVRRGGVDRVGHRG